MSGVSLIPGKAHLSGIFLIRAKMCCLAIVFVRGCAAGSAARVQGAVCGCVAACRKALGGSDRVSALFVGRNPTDAKPKIQGFTPTDKWPALRLFSSQVKTWRKLYLPFWRPGSPVLAAVAFVSPTLSSGLGKIQRALPRRERHEGNRSFMNSISTAARIAIFFAIALMFAPPLFGQGTNYEGPVGVAGIFNGNITTGCSYDPLTHSAHRAIDDIVVAGSIGKYPLKMTRYYNSRAQVPTL